ncbi:MAG: hypothetical protein IPN74_04635 [Haliscomenobacter sp.]|nr:hypothetical protein [Haliscomenobacter sp.]
MVLSFPPQAGYRSFQHFAPGAFSLAWVIFCLPFSLSGQGQLLALEDMHQIVALSSPRISPDGQSAVFIHRTTYGAG